MTTFTNVPTYFRVTWNNSSSNNYTSLPNSMAGGLDPTPPHKYHERVTVTSNVVVSGTPMSAGETILINGVTIPFTSSDTLSTIITTINTYGRYTGVFATNSLNGGCLTLMNALDACGESIRAEEHTSELQSH